MPGEERKIAYEHIEQPKIKLHEAVLHAVDTAVSTMEAVSGPLPRSMRPLLFGTKKIFEEAKGEDATEYSRLRESGRSVSASLAGAGAGILTETATKAMGGALLTAAGAAAAATGGTAIPALYAATGIYTLSQTPEAKKIMSNMVGAFTDQIPCLYLSALKFVRTLFQSSELVPKGKYTDLESALKTKGYLDHLNFYSGLDESQRALYTYVQNEFISQYLKISDAGDLILQYRPSKDIDTFTIPESSIKRELAILQDALSSQTKDYEVRSKRATKISVEKLQHVLKEYGIAPDAIETALHTRGTADVLSTFPGLIDKQFEALKTHTDYLKGFEGAQYLCKSLTTMGLASNNPTLMKVGEATSAMLLMAQGLEAATGCFSGAAVSLTFASSLIPAGMLLTGGMLLARLFMGDEDDGQRTDFILPALETISHQVRAVHAETLEIKSILQAGLKHLSDMLLYVHRNIAFLSEQQRVHYELTRKSYFIMQNMLQDVRIESREGYAHLSEDIRYLTDIVEAKELKDHKLRIEKNVFQIKRFFELKKSDNVLAACVDLESSILSLKEMSGLAEFSKIREPRQAIAFLTRRKGDALGFLAEEFERITETALSTFGINKRLLFATTLWRQATASYLNLLLQPHFKEYEPGETLDVLHEQAEHTLKFIRKISQCSDLFYRLLKRQNDYLDELQFLFCKLHNEQKQEVSVGETRGLIDSVLYQLNYNYLLLNQFAAWGGLDERDKKIIADLNHSAKLQLKKFNYDEEMDQAVRPYSDSREPVSYEPTATAASGYCTPIRCSYDNAKLEVMGGHLVQNFIEGAKILYMDGSILAPGSHRDYPLGRILLNLSSYYTQSEDGLGFDSRAVAARASLAAVSARQHRISGTAARSRTVSILGECGIDSPATRHDLRPTGPIPITYKRDVKNFADHAWASTHLVSTAIYGQKDFVLFTGGSGWVAVYSINEKRWEPCDNSSTPVSFSVPLWSTPTTTCYTNAAFDNKVLIVNPVRWDLSDGVYIDFQAFDLLSRSWLNSKEVPKKYETLFPTNWLRYPKTILSSPNQIFIRDSAVLTFSGVEKSLLVGVVIPGVKLGLSLSKKVYKSVDGKTIPDWQCCSKSLEFPISADAVNQVRSDALGGLNTLTVIAASVTHKDKNKLIFIFESTLKDKNSKSHYFDHYEYILPPVHPVADWQAMRTAPLRMGNRNYLLVTLLNPEFRMMIFLFDPTLKRVIRLADGPTMETIPIEHGRHFLDESRGVDQHLMKVRNRFPGFYPVNAFSIQVDIYGDVLKLYISYPKTDGAFSYYIGLKKYNIGPNLKANFLIGSRSLRSWKTNFTVDADKTPATLFTLALLDVQNKIASIKQKRELNLLSYDRKETEETKMDGENALLYVLQSCCRILIALFSFSNSHLEIGSTELESMQEILFELDDLVKESGYRDVPRIGTLLTSLSANLNMLDVTFKGLGEKYILKDNVEILLRQLLNESEKLTTKKSKPSDKLPFFSGADSRLPSAFSLPAEAVAAAPLARHRPRSFF